MKIQIENLKAQMQGRELNIYQKADALIEFNNLLDYVEELEQLTIPAVVEQGEKLCGNLNKNLICKNMCLTHCIDGNKFWK